MLLEQIKKEKMNAMKTKHEELKDLLSVILASATQVAMSDMKNPHKEPTDEELIKVIQKQIAANKECMIKIKDEANSGNEARLDMFLKLEYEVKMLEMYLPQMLSESELRLIISTFIATIPEVERPKAMGKVMAFLKQNHAGLYDGSVASKITKELL
jgi:uncharacterized protein YqeY